MVHAAVRPGDLVAGKYQVERLLGEGGMGFVVAAHHVALDQMVALKFLQPQIVDDAKMVARFVREARAAVKLHSGHVARVLDVGALPSGEPYIVMEFLDGLDLAAALHARGRLPISEAADVILQACEALVEAHALGMVHRDLKPANLFLTEGPDGEPFLKVLDFGIAKAGELLADQRLHTQSRVIMGSPAYMAPEQMRAARDVDARADIWSLGVIFYECITGKLPFDGPSLAEVCVKVMQAEPLPASELVAAPPELDALIARCLAKGPAHRFAGVVELAVALAPHASRSGAQSAERVVGFARARLRLPGSPQPTPLPMADTALAITPPPAEAAPDLVAEALVLLEPRRRRARRVGALVVSVLAGLVALLAWPRPIAEAPLPRDERADVLAAAPLDPSSAPPRPRPRSASLAQELLVAEPRPAQVVASAPQPPAAAAPVAPPVPPAAPARAASPSSPAASPPALVRRPPRDERAVALDDEALALERSGRCVDAIPRLVASHALDPDARIALRLGDCLRAQGQASSAWMRYREAARLARRGGEPQLAAQAERAALEVASERAWIVISYGAAPSELVRPPPDLIVSVAGQSLGRGELGRPLARDPGRVVIAASAPGFVSWSTSVMLEPSLTLPVRIPPLESDAEHGTPK